MARARRPLGTGDGMIGNKGNRPRRRTPTMPQFLLIAHDGDDAEALDRRMAVRPSHLEGIAPLVEAGQILVGGAILDDEGGMVGSMVLADFPVRAALVEWVSNDPYVTGDVWRRIEVVPYRAAVGAWMPPG
jgi:uncharacterized protein YciI